MIRFGYACQLLENNKNVSCSHRLTYTKFKQMDWEDAEKKLIEIGRKNLSNLLFILKYNYEHNIKLFRISSALIPLATHPDMDWDYLNLLKDEFKQIKDYLSDKDMRIDMHPGHFVLLNSQNPIVVERSKKDLEYHYNIMNAMGIDPKIVLHIGTFKPSKEEALKRFIDEFKKLPDRLKNMIMLENDDKTFTAFETYWLCKKLNIPMVFDVHHHRCNYDDFYLEWFFETWKNTNLNPKMHWSSPNAESKNYRAHSNDINIKEYKYLYDLLLNYDINIDIMLETKNKNLSIFKLLNKLKT